MPKFTNVSPLGDLDLPLVGRVIEFGETFDVTDAQAKGLAGQLTNWLPVDGNATPLNADLRAALEARGLPTTGTKAELTARLDEALAAATAAAADTTQGDAE